MQTVNNVDHYSSATIICLVTCFKKTFVLLLCGQRTACFEQCLFRILTLLVPRKNTSEKRRLLKSSAANNCLTLLTHLSIVANRVDPDQTAPIGAV